MRAKQSLLTLLLTIAIVVSFSTSGSSGWLIFHKSGLNGKILNVKTGMPIEGAVVVAIYTLESIIGGPGGSAYWRIHAKEALTDKKGKFHIPPFTTIMGPNSKEGEIELIFYKPGYGRYPSGKPPDYFIVGQTAYFSKEVGTKSEVFRGGRTITFTHGIVELRPLNSWDERRKAVPSRPSGIASEEYPLLNGIIRNEGEWLRNNKGWER